MLTFFVTILMASCGDNATTGVSWHQATWFPCLLPDEDSITEHVFGNITQANTHRTITLITMLVSTKGREDLKINLMTVDPNQSPKRRLSKKSIVTNISTLKLVLKKSIIMKASSRVSFASSCLSTEFLTDKSFL